MKPPMMRWKIVPLYSGSVVFSRVAGWVHSRRPSARSAKLATVFGAWSGKRSTVMSPWLVCSTARRAGVDSVTGPVFHASGGTRPATAAGLQRAAPAHDQDAGLPGGASARCTGSGDEGNRTPNPRLAKAVLCQLSYVPEG